MKNEFHYRNLPMTADGYRRSAQEALRFAKRWVETAEELLAKADEAEIARLTPPLKSGE